MTTLFHAGTKPLGMLQLRLGRRASSPLRGRLSFPRIEVDDDPGEPMSELLAGHPSFEAHAESVRNPLRRLIIGIDDGQDPIAAERLEHMVHCRTACFGRVTAPPEPARDPPSDLEMAGRAERLYSRYSDHPPGGFLDHGAHAEIVLRHP